MMMLEKKEAPAANRGIQTTVTMATILGLSFVFVMRKSYHFAYFWSMICAKMTPFVTRFKVKEWQNDSFSC
jgi:hypothetical protein